MKIFVQFSDSAESAVTGVFSCAQPADVVPFQGQITADDLRYQAFYVAALGADKQYLQAPSNP